MIDVYLIGSLEDRDFQRPIERLATCENARIKARFNDIDQAIPQIADAPATSQLTIVLQSTSQQFLQRDVDRLIAHTIQQSLICCYGSWCESDARSAPIWPAAIRIASRDAPEIIEQQIAGLNAGIPLPSALSAMEEACASQNAAWPLHHTDQRVETVCVMADRPFRATVLQVCRRLGLPTLGTSSLASWSAPPDEPAHPDGSVARGPARSTPGPSSANEELANIRPRLILIDLDSSPTCVRGTLTAARTQFPFARILGFTWHIDLTSSGKDDDGPDQRLPKLNFIPGLTAAIQSLTAAAK